MRLVRIFNKSNGSLGSDENGGSTNGEIKDKPCENIVKGLQLNSNDVLLDIGSGSGLTLTRLSALSNCKISIGVEIESQRYDFAMNFHKHLLENQPDRDFRLAFYNADITSLSSFDGFSKIYMYDPVFLSEDLRKIGKIFNKSKSVLHNASTKNLTDYGFNVELFASLGNQGARGSRMSHTFYIFKSLHYQLESSITNDIYQPDKKC